MRAGWMKTMFGQPDDAFGCFERALALSPYDPSTFNVYFGMAAAHGERHEYREASARVEKGLRAGPGVTWAYRMLASFYAQAERKSTRMNSNHSCASGITSSA